VKAPVARIASVFALLLAAGLLVVPAVASRPELVGCDNGRSYAGIEDLGSELFAGVRAVVTPTTRFSGLDRKYEFVSGWVAIGDKRRGYIELALRSSGSGENVFASMAWQGQRAHYQPLYPRSYIPWRVNEPHSLVIERAGSRSRWRLAIDGGTVKSLALAGSARGLRFPRVYLTAKNQSQPCNNRGQFLFTEMYVKSAGTGQWMPFDGAARSGFTSSDYPMKRLSNTSFIAGSGVEGSSSWLLVYGSGLMIALLVSVALVLVWTRRSYYRDVGLTLRLLGVTFLLVALQLPFFLLGVIWVYGQTSSLAAAALACLIELCLALTVPYFANRAILDGVRARVVDRSEAPTLHDLVERICALVDLPKPRIAIVESSIPNAFASGTGAKATIAVSEGLMGELELHELEAVVAHELAHIANGDAYVMTILSLPGALLSKLIAPFINAPSELKTTRAKVAAYFAVFSLPLMFLAWLAWTLSTLLVFSISRYREFVADRTAALIVGAPENVMSALVHIGDKLERIPDRDLRQIASADAFFIVALPSSGAITLNPSRMFPSHPPLTHRLDRLSAAARHSRHALGSASARSQMRSTRASNPAAWVALAFGVTTLLMLVPEIGSQKWTMLAIAAFVVSAYGMPFAVHALARAQRGATGYPYAATGLILCLVPWLAFMLGAVSFVVASSLHWVQLIQRT